MIREKYKDWLVQGYTGEKCFEFAKRFYLAHGIKIKNYWEKGFHKNWIEVQKPQNLDAIFFVPMDGMEGHVGIYIGCGYFIHTNKGRIGVVRLSLWMDRVEGYYRWQS